MDFDRKNAALSRSHLHLVPDEEAERGLADLPGSPIQMDRGVWAKELRGDPLYFVRMLSRLHGEIAGTRADLSAIEFKVAVEAVLHHREGGKGPCTSTTIAVAQNRSRRWISYVIRRLARAGFLVNLGTKPRPDWAINPIMYQWDFPTLFLLRQDRKGR